MRNITGQAVIGDDLYGREYELSRLWERLEQLEIMAANVAADTNFQGREDRRRKTLEFARDLIGPNTPVAESIQRVFTAQYPTIQSNIDEWMQSGRELLKSDNYVDAERAYRKAVDLQPDNLNEVSSSLGLESDETLPCLTRTTRRPAFGESIRRTTRCLRADAPARREQLRHPPRRNRAPGRCGNRPSWQALT